MKKSDWWITILFVTILAPFPFLAIFDAPFFPGWFLYFLWWWVAWIISREIDERTEPRNREFQHYEIGGEE